MSLWKKLITTIFVFLSLLYISTGTALAGLPDSLKALLATAREDTGKISLLIQLSYNAPDTSAKLSYGNEAARLARKIHSGRDLGKAYNALGFIYGMYINDTARAFWCYRNCLALTAKEADKDIRSQAYHGMATVYSNSSDFVDAIVGYNKCLKLYGPLDYSDKVNALGNAASCYEELGDHLSALDYYQKALNILSGTHDLKKDEIGLSRLNILNNMANVYSSISDDDRALQIYNDIIKQAADLDKNMQGIALLNAGSIYTSRKQYALALDYIGNAYNVVKIDRYESLIRDVFMNYCTVYTYMGDYVKAREYAEKTLKVQREAQDEYRTPGIYRLLGIVYRGEKKYPISLSYLYKALSIDSSRHTLDDENTDWEELSKTYKAMHWPAKELEAYKQFIITKDSLFGNRKQKEFARKEIQFEFEKIQARDSIREAEEKKILNLRLQKQKTYTYFGIAGIALLGLLSFFIFRNYSLQKKTNAIIQAEKQKSEELLLNILPEEVANELKQKGNVQARAFDDVSVLFTDFVNFTTAGENLTPQQLVNELDACFIAFDEIITKYGIEKIKTVGDAYLAVCGLPAASEDHATTIVKAAIE